MHCRTLNCCLLGGTLLCGGVTTWDVHPDEGARVVGQEGTQKLCESCPSGGVQEDP